MSLYVIPFPAFDPVLISFGPFAIRWVGSMPAP
jgi:prolipoprotein diacylglyceryltransferase